MLVKYIHSFIHSFIYPFRLSGTKGASRIRNLNPVAAITKHHQGSKYILTTEVISQNMLQDPNDIPLLKD